MTNPIERHFSKTQYVISPKMAEKEKYLFYSCVPFQRWMLLIICSFVQMCFGTFYAWSIFNTPLAKFLNKDSTNNYNYTDVAQVFYVCVGLFGLSACFAGPWIERSGPRMPCFVGSLFFFAGHMISALGCYFKLLELIFLGYGVFAGIGIGIGYICPVAALQKFYADKRGLASGIAVGSFGLGSVIASFFQSALINKVDVTYTFVIIGIVYFVFSGPFALLLRFPVPQHQQHQDSSLATTTTTTSVPSSSLAVAAISDPLPSSTATLNHASKPFDSSSLSLVGYIKTKNFGLLYLTFFTSVIPGLVLVSRVADICKNSYNRHEDATWVVGVNGLFNVLGRLFFGVLSDKLGRLPILMGSIATQMTILGVMLYGFFDNQFYVFIITVWILTGCYGAALGLVPSLITDCFGNAMISSLYGVLLTAWAAGGVLGGIGFTKVIQAQKNVKPLFLYNICIYAMIPIAFISLLLALYFQLTLRRSNGKKTESKVVNSGHSDV